MNAMKNVRPPTSTTTSSCDRVSRGSWLEILEWFDMNPTTVNDPLTNSMTTEIKKMV